MPPASPLRVFHPIVRSWFAETFGAPSEPQRLGWPAIASGRHTLLLAPTGTGKTQAAFLWELDRLIVRGLDAPLPNAVQILYVSPLKALSNDIHRNLERPLSELGARFASAGAAFPEIRVAVRTGDTPASARARMTRRSPHILITTPESLHIMLTTLRGRGMFSQVRTVIVDEIHAMAGTKRGAHLALSLERLEHLVERPPQRIGLSATQRPLDEIARFLGGCPPRDADAAPEFRPVTIIDCGLVKRMALEIVSVLPDGARPAGSVWPQVAEVTLSHVRGARTTLVFVNNRGQAERMAARLNELAGDDIARPYHGSLARERRVGLERALKAGELRALVTTSSLELGIDIGSVDLVVQLQSPKRVSSGLQRVGRSGHSLGASSRGVFVPTHRDDLVETAAVVDAMRVGEVEITRVPQNALDILAQALVAMTAVDDWTAADAYRLVRQAYPFHQLPRSAFDEVLGMLAGAYPADIAADLAPRLAWDRVTDRLTAARGSRLLAVTSGGTIPDRGLYTVVLPDRTRLGELDEEFVHESRVGDVFQLGSATWRIGAIEHDRVIVTPAPGAPARMPFWHGEYGARSAQLGRRVGALRRELADAARDDAQFDRDLAARLGCDLASVHAMRGYVAEQRAVTGIIPDERTVLIEQYRDEVGGVRVVVHSVFGGRVNAPWGMALAQRVRDALPDAEVLVQTSDDGILLRLPELSGAVPVRALVGLAPEEAEQRIIDEIGSTSLFGARFRMNAARALVLSRGSPRRRLPLWLQRLRAQDLLQAVRPFPAFPLLVETYREVLQDAFDLPALTEVLRAIAAGRIAVRTAEVDRPSPFAAGLQLGFVMEWLYTDDTPRAERRVAMLSVDRALLDEVMGTAADDDTLRMIDAVLADRRGTSPRRQARTVDELAHLLDRAGDLTIDELRARVAAAGDAGGDPLSILLESHRAVAIPIPAASDAVWRVTLTETLPRYAVAFGADVVRRVRTGVAQRESAAADVVPEAFLTPVVDAGAARREILARYVSLAGPFTVHDVQQRYAWPATWVAHRLEEWERSGRVVRGRFRPGVREQEWCSRTVAEQARRRALAAARREVQPVGMGVFAAFLQRWQHVDPRDRLAGSTGVEAVIRQLAGVARPADRWEIDYLPSRLERYERSWLSQLVARGQIAWAGSRRVDVESGAVALAAVRFFARGEGTVWIAQEGGSVLGAHAGAVRDALGRLGASFFDDLAASVGLGPTALRDALRELVAAGVVTNDTIDAMREVSRAPALPRRSRGDEPDPTRWLPAGVGPRRPIVQRRISRRRIPKWRPDRMDDVGWALGRWSLLPVDGGSPIGVSEAPDEESRAELVARRWLERYGIVTRDWWRRERPRVSWRAVYRVLRDLEYRGEVRRGYFVEGLAGAQFALPAAVELLRGTREASDRAAADPGLDEIPLVVITASDPANPYILAPGGGDGASLEHPRGPGALLVTRAGRVIASTEALGKRVLTARDLPAAVIDRALRTLADYVVRRERGAVGAGWRRRTRPFIVETIDGESASGMRWATRLADSGFRRTTRGLVFDPLGAIP